MIKRSLGVLGLSLMLAACGQSGSDSAGQEPAATPEPIVPATVESAAEAAEASAAAAREEMREAAATAEAAYDAAAAEAEAAYDDATEEIEEVLQEVEDDRQ